MKNMNRAEMIQAVKPIGRKQKKNNLMNMIRLFICSVGRMVGLLLFGLVAAVVIVMLLETPSSRAMMEIFGTYAAVLWFGKFFYENGR